MIELIFRNIVLAAEYFSGGFNTHFQVFIVLVYCAGVPTKEHRSILTDKCPHVVVGTPGCMHALCDRENTMDLSSCKHLVLDECNKMLDQIGVCPHIFDHAKSFN